MTMAMNIREINVAAADVAPERRAHVLAQVTDHHDEPPGFELRGGGQHMADHAPPAQLVEDLGGTGLHTCALTCGEDDHGSRAARTHFGGSWHRGLGMVQA